MFGEPCLEALSRINVPEHGDPGNLFDLLKSLPANARIESKESTVKNTELRKANRIISSSRRKTKRPIVQSCSC
jgi:hypothetical protein